MKLQRQIIFDILKNETLYDDSIQKELSDGDNFLKQYMEAQGTVPKRVVGGNQNASIPTANIKTRPLTTPNAEQPKGNIGNETPDKNIGAFPKAFGNKEVNKPEGAPEAPPSQQVEKKPIIMGTLDNLIEVKEFLNKYNSKGEISNIIAGYFQKNLKKIFGNMEIAVGDTKKNYWKAISVLIRSRNEQLSKNPNSTFELTDDMNKVLDNFFEVFQVKLTTYCVITVLLLKIADVIANIYSPQEKESDEETEDTNDESLNESILNEGVFSFIGNTFKAIGSLIKGSKDFGLFVYNQEKNKISIPNLSTDAYITKMINVMFFSAFTKIERQSFIVPILKKNTGLQPPVIAEQKILEILGNEKNKIRESVEGVPVKEVLSSSQEKQINDLADKLKVQIFQTIFKITPQKSGAEGGLAKKDDTQLEDIEKDDVVAKEKIDTLKQIDGFNNLNKDGQFFVSQFVSKSGLDLENKKIVSTLEHLIDVVSRNEKIFQGAASGNKIPISDMIWIKLFKGFGQQTIKDFVNRSKFKVVGSIKGISNNIKPKFYSLISKIGLEDVSLEESFQKAEILKNWFKNASVINKENGRAQFNIAEKTITNSTVKSLQKVIHKINPDVDEFYVVKNWVDEINFKVVKDV